jgi:hypothetical protein
MGRCRDYRRIIFDVVLVVFTSVCLGALAYSFFPAPREQGFAWAPIAVYETQHSELETPTIFYSDHGHPQITVGLAAKKLNAKPAYLFVQDQKCTSDGETTVINHTKPNQFEWLAVTELKISFVKQARHEITCSLGASVQPRAVDFAGRELTITLTDPERFYWKRHKMNPISRPSAVLVKNAAFQLDRDLPGLSVSGGLPYITKTRSGQRLENQDARLLTIDSTSSSWEPSIRIRYNAARAAELLQLGELIGVGILVGLLSAGLFDLLKESIVAQSSILERVAEDVAKLESRLGGVERMIEEIEARKQLYNIEKSVSVIAENTSLSGWNRVLKDAITTLARVFERRD